jgi:hypothetical protein
MRNDAANMKKILFVFNASEHPGGYSGFVSKALGSEVLPSIIRHVQKTAFEMMFPRDLSMLSKFVLTAEQAGIGYEVFEIEK